MIGIFDSGLGGLTALKEIRALLPSADILYFGDTGRVPYGTKSRNTINKYARQDVEFLLSRGVDSVLAACGTVSSVALDNIKSNYNIPILGVVNAAAEKAAKTSSNGIIGVIGTSATVNSHCFENKIKEIRSDATVHSTACPLFVPLVENGYIEPDNQITTLVAKQYLEKMKNAEIDTLILGCTHFPIIEKIISSCLPGVSIVNASREAAWELADTQKNVRGSGRTEYYVSDDPQNFDTIASLFLGCKDKIHATKIEIEKY